MKFDVFVIEKLLRRSFDHVSMAKVTSEIKKQMVTLITSAFGFVAALQWNEAIKAWLKPVISARGGAVALTFSAIVVTTIAAVVIYFIGKLK